MERKAGRTKDLETVSNPSSNLSHFSKQKMLTWTRTRKRLPSDDENRKFVTQLCGGWVSPYKRKGTKNKEEGRGGNASAGVRYEYSLIRLAIV